MRSSSLVRRVGSLSLVVNNGVAGFHRRNLSLAGQFGRNGDEDGVSLGGKCPMVLGIAVFLIDDCCPNRSRPRLVPLKRGFCLIETSGNGVEAVVFPLVSELSLCGRFWVG